MVSFQVQVSTEYNKKIFTKNNPVHHSLKKNPKINLIKQGKDLYNGNFKTLKVILEK